MTGTGTGTALSPSSTDHTTFLCVPERKTPLYGGGDMSDLASLAVKQWERASKSCAYRGGEERGRELSVSVWRQ